MLRAIPSSMNPATVAAIDARLAAIARDENVTIPLAIESGSRAWGFPSPDSDYDCRFIFIRPRDDYLTLFAKRDVIETPLENDLDINGWDLAKAIKLLLKGNAVVIEWLTSPIAYGVDLWFRDNFLAVARQVADRPLIARHYLHLGLGQRHNHFRDGEPLPLKKLFYVLRPATALRWLRLNPDQAVAPMHFPTLMVECDAPHAVKSIIDDLIARKAVTRELGEGLLPPEIGTFIDTEFELATKEPELRKRKPNADRFKLAEEFFRAVLARIEGAN